ncbi:MAG: helix-turn-helix transcriptional regulator [Deltaproteobacteria bacterium]|nr:helix-turn-helix transcriptional regulator [Deltaproteobacteria bacterium]
MVIPQFNPAALRRLREEKNLSVRELSAHLLVYAKEKISGQTIHSHESGISLPNADKLSLYSKFFGKPMEFFFSESPK